MKPMLLVMLGGAVGSLARYLLASLVSAGLGRPAFPFGHLAVNVTGCFLIGLVAEVTALRADVDPAVRLALVTGVLGGYTTFSSFALETIDLLRAGQVPLATLNAVASVVLGVAAAWLGIRVAAAVA